VDAAGDLASVQRTLQNAYSLYLKTRPAASSESAKRAKGLPKEGPHPMLLGKLPATRRGNLQVGGFVGGFSWLGCGLGGTTSLATAGPCLRGVGKDVCQARAGSSART
jgi:hypothetical protein